MTLSLIVLLLAYDTCGVRALMLLIFFHHPATLRPPRSSHAPFSDPFPSRLPSIFVNNIQKASLDHTYFEVWTSLSVLANKKKQTISRGGGPPMKMDSLPTRRRSVLASRLLVV